MGVSAFWAAAGEVRLIDAGVFVVEWAGPYYVAKRLGGWELLYSRD